MSIKASDIPLILIERIEASHPVPAHFEVDETHDWPVEALPLLLQQKVLTITDRAEVITCPGCEQQCHKQVEVLRVGAVRGAFIICDEDPAYGRVKVPLVGLLRFETGLHAISQLIATNLNLSSPKMSRNQTAYGLGNLKGRNGVRPVLIGIEDGQLVLGVGQRRETLARILKWTSSGLAVDAKLTQRLADRKGASSARCREYTSDRTRQQSRAAGIRRRNAQIFSEAKKRHAEGDVTWVGVAADLAGTNLTRGLGASTVRRIITAMSRERKYSRSKTQIPK